MGWRSFLAAGLLVAACSSKGDSSASGTAATPAPTGGGDPAATPGRTGKPLAGDPADLPALRVDALDDRRWVIDDAVVTQIAVDAAAGQLRAHIAGDGIHVDEVAADSTLARLGFAAGDLVGRIDGVAITGAGDLRAAWNAARGEGAVTASVSRAGQVSERRYYLYGSLDAELRAEVDPRRPGGDSADNPAAPRLLAALRTGVRAAGPDSYEVDEKVIAVGSRDPGPAPVGPTHPGFGHSGVRLIDDGGLPAALGLTRYDVIKAVDDQDLYSYVGLADQLSRLARDKPREFTISVVRVREPLVLRYRLISDLVMDAELDAALAEWRAKENELHPRVDPFPPLPPGPYGADAGTGTTLGVDDPFADEIDRAITKIDDEHYKVDRALVSKVLDNPMLVARGARIVPSIKDGKPNGFKLYAIRPSSLYAKIGLMNGDTIIAVNGMEVTTPDRALEVYTRVKDARTITLDLIRRGKPARLSYLIR